MGVCLEATWFVLWALTVIGVLRLFHNAAEFDDRINNLDEWRDSQGAMLRLKALESQPRSRAS